MPTTIDIASSYNQQQEYDELLSVVTQQDFDSIHKEHFEIQVPHRKWHEIKR